MCLKKEQIELISFIQSFDYSNVNFDYVEEDTGSTMFSTLLIPILNMHNANLLDTEDGMRLKKEIQNSFLFLLDVAAQHLDESKLVSILEKPRITGQTVFHQA